MDTEIAILFVLFALVNCGEISKQSLPPLNLAFHPHEASATSVSLLQQAADRGVVEAEENIALAKLLGLGLEQDIEEAVRTSSGLVEGRGGARAHTTLGLLLAHNLTAREMSEEQRQTQALSHFVLAAISDDPLAQVITGAHYMRKKDCEGALNYYRKAALAVAPSLPDEVAVTPSIPRFVWPEDDPFAQERPTLEELQMVQHLASYGDTNAAVKAAVLLHRGMPGQPRNITLAANYLQQAVEGNSTSAMVMLSALMLHHKLPQIQYDVHEMLTTALSRGDEIAHAYLGLLYYRGHNGIGINIQKAKAHFIKAASFGVVEAYYYLGKLLSETQGGHDEAAVLWEMAASADHAPSAFLAGELYWEKLKQSSTNPKSTSMFPTTLCHTAVAMYRKVALAGNWLQLFDSAYEDYLAQNYGPAILKYLLLSDLGYSAAYINAGRLLDSGLSDILGEDATRFSAVKVWQRAADSGIVHGHIRLGDLYYYGDGVEQNYTTSFEKYIHAATLGSAQAMYNAASMVEWGEGQLQNLTKALKMYNNAMEMDSDAMVPAYLAMFRIDMFSLINSTLSIDLYNTEWHIYVQYLCSLGPLDSTAFSTQLFDSGSEVMGNLRENLPPWDILVMVMLAVVIAVMLVLRR